MQHPWWDVVSAYTWYPRAVVCSQRGVPRFAGQGNRQRTNFELEQPVAELSAHLTELADLPIPAALCTHPTSPPAPIPRRFPSSSNQNLGRYPS